MTPKEKLLLIELALVVCRMAPPSDQKRIGQIFDDMAAADQEAEHPEDGR